MSDLIDRESAIVRACAVIKDDYVAYDVVQALKAMPSAQPKIIRCEDCMHNGSFDTDCPIDWNGKEYCSFAERIDDE